MFCANCGNEVKDGARFCVSCGSEVLRRTANAAPAANQASATPPARAAKVYEAVSSADRRTLRQTAPPARAAEVYEAVRGPQQLYQNQNEYTWGWWILGVISAFLIGIIITNNIDDVIMLGIYIGILVFSLVYAAAIYPSLFTNAPKLKSEDLISFLNGFLGGLLFGALWQINLRKNKKGVSHIVFIVLYIVCLIYTIIYSVYLVSMSSVGVGYSG